MQNNGIALPTAFKIYFDKNIKNYLLASGSDNSEAESIVFVKLENHFVNIIIFKIRKLPKNILYLLARFTFLSKSTLSIIIFIIKNRNFALKLELAYGNEETKTKIFNKEYYKVVKIGRNRENDIVLENYAYSRIHTSFYFNSQDNAWYVQDGIENKTSTNGTWYLYFYKQIKDLSGLALDN